MKLRRSSSVTLALCLSLSAPAALLLGCPGAKPNQPGVGQGGQGGQSGGKGKTAAAKASNPTLIAPEAIAEMIDANQGIMAFTLSLPKEDQAQAAYQLHALPKRTESVEIEVEAGGQKVKTPPINRSKFVNGKATITIENLPAGDAKVTVRVLDKAGGLIAEGSKSARVEPGKITPLEIVLEVRPDTGALAITVDAREIVDPVPVPPVTAKGPRNSNQLALTPGGKELWVVNADNDSVSVIDTGTGALLASIAVGKEPESIAITPDGTRAFVANAVSGTVMMIDVPKRKVATTTATGAEPFDLAITPNGSRVYVANSRSNTVSVLDGLSGLEVTRINGVGPMPRGIAITNDGDADDTDELVFVTEFLAAPLGGDMTKVASYQARVNAIRTSNNGVAAPDIALQNVTNTGFDNKGAVPNNLGGIVIRGDVAYIPATGSMPDTPRKVLANMTAVAASVDTKSLAAGPSSQLDKPTFALMHNIPFAMAFKPDSDTAYVVSSGSNAVTKATVVNGALQYVEPVVDIQVGDNPRAIVIDDAGTRAYVLNYISRDVSVIDLATDKVVATFKAADKPAPGSPDFAAWRGKLLFNSSREDGKLAKQGSGSCATCHWDGLTDNVIWRFGSGPRKSISLDGSFAKNGSHQRVFNFSGAFDETQDFELNTRGTSGGTGLIPNVATADIKGFQKNAGRSPDLDAIEAYIRTIRAPIAQRRGEDVAKGRALFQAANCAACHGGPVWSSPKMDWDPANPGPVLADSIAEPKVKVVKKALFDVGTFDAAKPYEKKPNGDPANGAEGFNPPSLLGVGTHAPYLHDGSALTLEAVLSNVKHRSAGTGTDTLVNAADRAELIRFLESIDESTPAFPIGTLPAAKP